jgi:molecular chaperone GrpE
LQNADEFLGGLTMGECRHCEGKEVEREKEEIVENCVSSDGEGGCASEPLEEELRQSRERIAELEDLLLRARADFENYRKRMARDYEERMQLANEALIGDLLPILDNFTLGLKAAKQSGNREIVYGFELIWNQLQQLFATQGVVAVGTVGEAFNSHSADAITMVASEDIPEGHIVEVIRPGYFLGKKLLRPAAVSVSRGPCRETGDVTE